MKFPKDARASLVLSSIVGKEATSKMDVNDLADIVLSRMPKTMDASTGELLTENRSLQIDNLVLSEGLTPATGKLLKDAFAGKSSDLVLSSDGNATDAAAFKTVMKLIPSLKQSIHTQGKTGAQSDRGKAPLQLSEDETNPMILEARRRAEAAKNQLASV